ncbi:pilus assembly protein PilM [Thiohalorhabdus methylotrophus]|uniref:Pilus assembly protein PilM n=1 Tax=Thiohalorhabdus methylotrophus TaxID=3242694 RepID=A0ABV4TYH2_9GAMM
MVDVREGALILALLRKGATVPCLSALTRIPLADHEQSDPEPLAERLGREVEERGLEGCPAATLLYRPQFSLILTESPGGVEGEDLRAAMQWRVRDLLDFPVEDAVLDVLPIPELDLPGEGPPLFVVAAQRRTVKERVQAGRDAGLDLRVVDIPDMAHRNLGLLLPDQDASGTCLLVLDTENPLISISRGGELIFSRQLAVDIGEEIEEVARRLDVEGDEARQLAASHGLAGMPEAPGKRGMTPGAYQGPEEGGLELEAEPSVQQADPLHAALTDYAERLALEVQRSLDYYDSRFRQAAIRKVHIAGTGSRVNGLEEYLAGALGLDFRQFDPLSHLETTELLRSEAGVDQELLQEAVYAIGAGLRLMDAGGG